MRLAATSSGFAMLTLGLLIGLLTGLSNSPVVGVVLPLLFGVIGGTSGLYFAKLDVRDQVQQARIAFVSMSILLLCLGTFFGTWKGMTLRRSEPPAWRSMGRAAGASTGDEAVRWVLLETRLAMLGLAEDDREIIMSRISTAAESPAVPDIAEDLRVAVELLRKAMPPETAIPPERRQEWVGLERGLLAALAAAEEFTVEEQRSFVHKTLSLVLENTGLLTDDDEDKSYMAQNVGVAEKLARLEMRLLRVSSLIELPASGLESASDLLDLFLATHERQSQVTPGRGLASTSRSSTTADG